MGDNGSLVRYLSAHWRAGDLISKLISLYLVLGEKIVGGEFDRRLSGIMSKNDYITGQNNWQVLR